MSYVRHCERCGRQHPQDRRASTPYPWRLCLKCALETAVKAPPPADGILKGLSSQDDS